MSSNQIYQYSVVHALMDGVAGKGIPVATLLKHGDIGLGTFRYLIGELVMLDGVAYQMKSDGSVIQVDVSPTSDAVAPFAMTTHFKPTVVTNAVVESKAHLYELISSLLPGTQNIYLAIRISGVFKSTTVRTVGGQTKPNEGLAEVGKHQTSHVFEEPMEGSIVGFRSPEYMQGISVAGDHLHLISKDRKRGGHLLALASDGEIKIEVTPVPNFHLELPVDDKEFSEAELRGDLAGIAAVEG